MLSHTSAGPSCRWRVPPNSANLPCWMSGCDMVECRECWWRHNQLSQQRCAYITNKSTCLLWDSSVSIYCTISLAHTQKVYMNCLHRQCFAVFAHGKAQSGDSWLQLWLHGAAHCVQIGFIAVRGAECVLSNTRTETPRLVFRCPAGRGMEGLCKSPTSNTIGKQIYSNSKRDKERCQVSSSSRS